MRKKDVFIVGFMLFAMFFGAGNLIFPVALGFLSGEMFWPAILGFILTGVGLPLLSVIVGSLSESGYRGLLKQVHPFYSVLFLSVVYLTIGPFFAIPRTATTAYEIGVVPFLGESTGTSLFLFSLFFFLIVLGIALNPNRLADNIGKFLTPILLAIILFLIARAWTLYSSNEPQAALSSYQLQSPFILGFTEGYLTMDAIAAIAFSLIVVNAIRDTGLKDKEELLKGTIKASFLAVILLALIYAGLGWAGNRMNLREQIPAGQNLGAFLLQTISHDAFGSYGILLLGTMVFLSCLTTAVGLIAAVSEYFNSLLPKITYRSFAVLFTFISFVLANQGLDRVIQTSVPVLGLIYPVAISTVLLVAFSYFVPSPKRSLQLPVIFVSMISLLSVIHRQAWLPISWLEILPLFKIQLEWLPFLIAGYLAGYLTGAKRSKVVYQ